MYDHGNVSILSASCYAARTVSVERQMAIMAPAEDTRRFRRYPVRVFVQVSLPARPRLNVLQGISNDLCAQGMSLYVPEQLHIGQEIQIGFHLPITGDEIALKAVVRDSDGFRCGVEFSDLSGDHQTVLADCCSRLSLTLPDNTRRRRWERRLAMNLRGGA